MQLQYHEYATRRVSTTVGSVSKITQRALPFRADNAAPPQPSSRNVGTCAIRTVATRHSVDPLLFGETER